MNEETLTSAAIDIFLPVLESAMIYASHYCKTTGRNTVTSEDMRYGWRYAARVTLGNKLGSFFPEIYDSEEDSEEEDWADMVDDESEEPFVRYTPPPIGEGEGDPLMLKMNEVHDTWDSWEPETPAERMIKNAVDSSDGRVFKE
jgi:histone H3/H4